jgi:glutathione S-transferase
MYTLHYAPDNASLIVRLVLDGAGIPYRTALVDRRTRQQDSPTYRALNPAGLVPTLETPQGPISETGAILLWLSDTHHLGPAVGHPDRPTFPQVAVLPVKHRARRPADDLLPAPIRPRRPHRRASRDHLRPDAAPLRPDRRRRCEKPAAFRPGGPAWRLRGRADPLVRALSARCRGWFDLAAFPALAALARAQEARVETPVVARAEGLGDRPLHPPGTANPPEGSVL